MNQRRNRPCCHPDVWDPTRTLHCNAKLLLPCQPCREIDAKSPIHDTQTVLARLGTVVDRQRAKSTDAAKSNPLPRDDGYKKGSLRVRLLSQLATIMRFFLVTLLAVATSTAVLGASMHEPRQVDCSSYGEYEEYTGPCETSSELISPTNAQIKLTPSLDCGASGTVCRNGQGCVIFPGELLQATFILRNC